MYMNFSPVVAAVKSNALSTMAVETGTQFTTAAGKPSGAFWIHYSRHLGLLLHTLYTE
jgi:hypothetical protein